MARFPYQPGAGAKAIKNPIYWNRLYLQESRYRGSATRSKHNQLTARWLNVNTNLNFFLCGWYKPVVDNADRLTTKEVDTLNDRLDTVFEYRDTIASSPDYFSQPNLNKFVTQVKRLLLLVFKLCIKYRLFQNGEERLTRYWYDPKKKDFLLFWSNGSQSRRYFMGDPAADLIEEIREKYRQSVEMVDSDFGKAKTSQHKKKAMPRKRAPARRKKPHRQTKPSATSRARGVVEEIVKPNHIRFRYLDCRDRQRAVRNRLKLHMKIALQPFGAGPVNTAVLDDVIDTLLLNALKLGQGDSIKFPFMANDKELLVFEVFREVP